MAVELKKDIMSSKFFGNSKLKDQPKKLLLKKEVAALDMPVKKHHYSLEEELHMVQKEKFIKLRK